MDGDEDTKPRNLDHDLVEEFFESLTRAGFPTRERMRPALTDEEMDAIVEPLGLWLPTEARIWWSHHNGGQQAPISSGRDLASLKEIVSATKQLRELDSIDPDIPTKSWDPRLLPLVHSEEIFGCDCSVPAGAPSPVSVWIPKDAEDLGAPILPSIGSLVEIWLTAIEEGLWEWLPEKGRAIRHFSKDEVGRWPYGLP